jgi:hypothetical protein
VWPPWRRRHELPDAVADAGAPEPEHDEAGVEQALQGEVDFVATHAEGVGDATAAEERRTVTVCGEGQLHEHRCGVRPDFGEPALVEQFGLRQPKAPTGRRSRSGLGGVGSAAGSRRPALLRLVGALLRLLLGALGGFLLAVGLADDLDDLGAVHDAIDQRADARCTGEHLGPLGEGLVAGQHGRSLQVPPLTTSK